MVRVYDFGPKGPGFKTRESQKNTLIHMFAGRSRIDNLISSLKQRPTTNRIDSRLKENKGTNKKIDQKIDQAEREQTNK